MTKSCSNAHVEETFVSPQSAEDDGSPAVPKTSDRIAGGGTSSYTATYSNLKRLHHTKKRKILLLISLFLLLIIVRSLSNTNRNMKTNTMVKMCSKRYSKSSNTIIEK